MYRIIHGIHRLPRAANGRSHSRSLKTALQSAWYYMPAGEGLRQVTGTGGIFQLAFYHVVQEDSSPRRRSQSVTMLPTVWLSCSASQVELTAERVIPGSCSGDLKFACPIASVGLSFIRPIAVLLMDFTLQHWVFPAARCAVWSTGQKKMFSEMFSKCLWDLSETQRVRRDCLHALRKTSLSLVLPAGAARISKVISVLVHDHPDSTSPLSDS